MAQKILILGSRFDITCDYVVAQLRKLGCSYIRLNSEDINKANVTLDPISVTFRLKSEQSQIEFAGEEILSVFYRRPVYLRDYEGYTQNGIEMLSRNHWAAFLRNLMVFDRALWVNHPAATYYAEHKGLQLHFANQVGMKIPTTLITNSEESIKSIFKNHENVAVKGIDTVLFRNNNNESFGFTNIVDVNLLTPESVEGIPLTVQEHLEEKTDIRVTVVGTDVYSASISKGDGPILGDWRLYKNQAHFVKHELPPQVEEKCRLLVKKLGLVYGGIDLALSEGEYYFIEINPTGEWGWLVDTAKLPIDSAFAKCLSQS